MSEFRFLRVTKDPSAPTFIRLHAPSRIEAIEQFAGQLDLHLRAITDEIVYFTTSEGGRIKYSVSGASDPLVELLFAAV